MNVNYARFSFPGLKSQFVYSASGTGARGIDRVLTIRELKAEFHASCYSHHLTTKRNIGRSARPAIANSARLPVCSSQYRPR